MSGWSNWKVLVTGAGGYVGLNLVAALAGACRLRCLVRQQQPFWEALEVAVDAEAREAIEVVEADVRDRDAVRRACEGVTVIVHLAALTADERPSQFELLQVNLLGCQAVLEGAGRAGAARVILPSTYHIYGRLRALPAGPVGEETPLNPASVYAASKAVAESMARSAGVEEVILRLSHLYGVGVGRGDMGGVLVRFIDQAVQGSVITLDAGAADVRDYLHISDAVDCMRTLALARDSVRGTFNVGFGQSVTLGEMASWVADGVGRAKGGSVEVRIPQDAAAPPRRAFLDLRKIRQTCNFTPQRNPKQGIDELLERRVPASWC